MSLPTCKVQPPACGACGSDTDHDGDSFICYGCLLNYGDGEDGTEAQFLEEVTACGIGCDNYWHGSGQLNLTCQPCQLPKGHTSLHWTDCK